MSGNLDKDISGLGTTTLNSDTNISSDRAITGTLALNNHTIDMQQQAPASTTYNTLSVGNLTGTGTLKIDANMANNAGVATASDKIHLTNGTSSNATLDLTSINVTNNGTDSATVYQDFLTYLDGNGKDDITYLLAGSDTGTLRTDTADHKYFFTLGSKGKLNVLIREAVTTLPQFIQGDNMESVASTYSILTDTVENEVIGTTYRTGTASKDLTVYINNNATLSSTGLNGITVDSGYSLDLDSNTSGTMSGFNTALAVNNGGTLTIDKITLTGNTTDINNAGTLNLANVSAGTVTGTGDTNVTGTSNITSLTQGSVDVTNSGTLTVTNIAATNGISNTGALNIQGTTLASNISGTGATAFTNNIASTGNITQDTISIATGKTLTNSGAIIVNNTLTNAGTLANNNTLNLAGSSMTIAGAITGNGTTTVSGSVTNNGTIANALNITGSLTSDASNITGAIDNEGTLKFNSGANANTITGDGNLYITGTVSNTADISNAITINESNQFTTGAGNILNGVTNTSGTLILNDGTLGSAVTGAGNTQIAGDVTNSSTIANNVSILSTGTLTSDISDLTGTVTNAGSFLMSGNLDKDISGLGTTTLQTDTNISADRTISGTLALNNHVIDMQNSTPAYNTLSLGKLTGSGVLKIDADMANAGGVATASDKLNILGTGSDATLNLTSINVTNNGTDSSTPYTNFLTYVSGGDIDGITYLLNGSTTGSLVTETSDHRYTFTQGTNGKLDVLIRPSQTTLKQFIEGDAGGVDTYSINNNQIEYENVGTTYREAGQSKDLNLFINNNSILSASGTQTIEGITVDDGYSLAIDSNSTGTITNFKTALTVNEEADLFVDNITFTDNEIDINNNGNLELGNTNAEKIIGSGDITVSGDSSVTSMTQGTVNIASTGRLSANTITTTDNNLSNEGTLELTGSANNNKISGSGKTVIAGNLINNNIIENTVNVNNGSSLTTSAIALQNTTNNDGTLNLLGGIAQNDITGSGTTNLNNDIFLNNNISGNTLSLNNGIMTIGSDADFSGINALDVHGGGINTINNIISSTTFNTINLYDASKLRIDVDLAKETSDNFIASINDQGGIFNIDSINIFDAHNISKNNIDIDLGLTTNLGSEHIYVDEAMKLPSTMTLIRKLNGRISDGHIIYSPAGNSYSDFNPSALATSVAAQAGGYVAMLNSYDEAFRNMDMYMLMSSKDRMLYKYKNKIASGTTQGVVFDPTNTAYENKNIWFRPFTSFESIPFHNGPKISNITYGSYFGGETDIVPLGHGWDGTLGAYVGYFGSHQTYSGNSIYQNGGTMGLVGMAYKDNFFAGLTINAGASGAEASTMYGSDEFAMLMAGIAAKAGYNWELKDGKYIIQPQILASYSFINALDYKNAAGLQVEARPLHAIQIEPGIKFIANLDHGWQPYVNASVVMNFMDRTNIQIADTALPAISINPYAKYGIGIRKTVGDRFTGFIQTYIMNGGRNGIGFQLGLRWAIGKDSNAESTQTPAKVTVIKQLKK